MSELMQTLEQAAFGDGAGAGMVAEPRGHDVAALRDEVAALTRRLGRPALGGAAAETKSQWADGWLRKGVEPAGYEVKRFSTATPGEGGVAVPAEIDARIERALMGASPIRGLAQVVRVGTAGYRKLVARGGFGAGWVGSDAARPETATPDFAEISPPMGELYANPAASQQMLDDAMFDVEAWLADEIAGEFARAEGMAFVSGNGANRPRGFLTYPTSAAGDAARPFGTVQHLATGVAGGFGANAGDRLIDLVHALRAPYRQGAAFVMNSATVAAVRRLKDAGGDHLWRPSFAEGQPATLLGYPVVEADAMPDVADGALAIAFGNFRAAYLIADRGETAVLRDPYSNKPFVHFYATRRVGGAVVNAEALKLLRFSAA